ncbi:alcohol dehydrogenase catalytic domain-containing protein [Spirillospora sp. CA-255316]
MPGCGICGSDVHIIDGSTLRAYLPVTLGHEASGVVVPAGNVVPLPDSVDFGLAAIVADAIATLASDLAPAGSARRRGGRLRPRRAPRSRRNARRRGSRGPRSP